MAAARFPLSLNNFVPLNTTQNVADLDFLLNNNTARAHV